MTQMRHIFVANFVDKACDKARDKVWVAGDSLPWELRTRRSVDNNVWDKESDGVWHGNCSLTARKRHEHQPSTAATVGRRS